jgi:hypothetical protein
MEDEEIASSSTVCVGGRLVEFKCYLCL